MKYSKEVLDKYIDYRCHKLGWDESQRGLAAQMLLPKNFKELKDVVAAVLKTYEGTIRELDQFSNNPDDFMIEIQLKAAFEEESVCLQDSSVDSEPSEQREDNFYSKFAAFVHSKRYDMFLSQEKLAKASGLTLQAIKNAEIGAKVKSHTVETLLFYFNGTEQDVEDFDPEKDKTAITIEIFSDYMKHYREQNNMSQLHLSSLIKLVPEVIEAIEEKKVEKVFMPALKAFCLGTKITPREISDFGKAIQAKAKPNAMPTAKP